MNTWLIRFFSIVSSFMVGLAVFILMRCFHLTWLQAFIVVSIAALGGLIEGMLPE